MGSNYEGPAKHVTDLKGVLEATTSRKIRTWKTRELDYLYDVASGMLRGAKDGDLLQLQNSLREIVARKSDVQTRPFRWIAAVSAVAAVVTATLKATDSAKIRDLEYRVGVLESQPHSPPKNPVTPPSKTAPTTGFSTDKSASPRDPQDPTKKNP